MYAHKHQHVDHELLKWLVLISMTLLLVLIATRSTVAEPIDAKLVDTLTSRVEAALLPNDLPPKRRLDVERLDFERPKNELQQLNPTARCLLEIFELHEKREFETAIERWQELSLFDCDEPWRAAAVGATYLQLGAFDDGLCVLRELPETTETNAVIYHLRGVAHWMSARVATREGKLYLAEEYRDLARTNFKKAIATSSQVKLDEKLGLVITKYASTQRFGPHDTIFPELLLPRRTPRVRDLLSVLNLEDFVAKSHLGLAELNLREGFLEEVEDHLDDAADAGSDVAELYSILGEAYEADGQSKSAARAYMKAMTGKQKIIPGTKEFRNLRKD